MRVEVHHYNVGDQRNFASILPREQTNKSHFCKCTQNFALQFLGALPFIPSRETLVSEFIAESCKSRQSAWKKR